MKQNRVVIWFRNDLRVHDHAPLFSAFQKGKEVIPVYCVDPRIFEKTSLGFSKTGFFRADFLQEAVDNLRANLRTSGSDLFILTGKPEETVVDFAHQIGASDIYVSEEVTQEEKQVEEAL